MAILKHLASKNANYYAALEYLKYQYDERRGEPVRNRFGNLVPREDILLDCENVRAPETFASECLRLNRHYKKNNRSGDIMTHHYILSFDPRDGQDGLLDNKKALEIAKKLAGEFLPGHQTLFAVHPDGSNGSGNIHVHIVINSIRKDDIERAEWMTKPNHYKAGCKHTCLKAFQVAFKQRVMEVCAEAGLHQTNILDPALDRVSEKEYWAQIRGEEKTQKKWAEKQKIKETSEKNQSEKPFKTGKEQLRSALRSALRRAQNIDDYRIILAEEFGISIKESRGVWSYVIGNSKPVRARKLGARYEKDGVETYIEKQIARAQKTNPEVKKVIDVDANQKAQESEAYRRKLIQINMERRVRAAAYLNKKGITGEEELNAFVAAAEKRLNEQSSLLNRNAAEMKLIDNLAVQRARYAATRAAYKKYKESSDPDRYKRAHKAEIEQYEAAVKAMNEAKKFYGVKKLPDKDMLESRRRELQAEQRNIYSKIPKLREELTELKNTQENILSILHPEEYQKKLDRLRSNRAEKQAERNKTEL